MRKAASPCLDRGAVVGDVLFAGDRQDGHLVARFRDGRRRRSAPPAEARSRRRSEAAGRA
jgi:hypothetical protein